jgi:hypothetical protein
MSYEEKAAYQNQLSGMMEVLGFSEKEIEEIRQKIIKEVYNV